MKIIISPAKKMNTDTDSLPVQGIPAFLEQTEQIYERLRQMSYEELKKLWACNDKLAELNYRRLEQMELRKNLTPAVIAYEGLQYQHMSPLVFTDKALSYIQEHLRILSGFYGVLAPFDGVVPYRLEMQAALSVDGAADLYAFWGKRLYSAVLDEDKVIVNLASKEYARAVEKYLEPEDNMITCIFGELVNGKVKQKGTFAKMARGEMVRFLAENDIRDVERIKDFREMGCGFCPEYSDEKNWVFVHEGQKK